MSVVGISSREIEDLKAAHPSDTRQLVKEVASRLFLAGERPTRQRVRDLIGRGSMTTIDAGLREWWDGLRRQTRAEIDVPDVPEALVPAFQAAVKGLWELASAEAQAAFEEERTKLAQTAEEAIAREKSAVDRGDVLDAALVEARAAAAASKERVVALEQGLADAREARDALTATLGQEREVARRERAEHATALEKVTTERTREREALEGQLAFATRQIDEAREKTKGLVADLDRERKRGERIEAQAREDTNAAQDALNARTRERDDARAEASRVKEDAAALRSQVESLESRLTDTREFADRVQEGAKQRERDTNAYVALLKKESARRADRTAKTLRRTADALAKMAAAEDRRKRAEPLGTELRELEAALREATENEDKSENSP